LISIIAGFVLTILTGVVLSFRDSIRKNISKINIRLVSFFTLLFLAVYFYLASEYYFTGENFSLGIIAVILLIPLQFIGFVYSLRLHRKMKSFVLKQILFVMIVLLIYQAIILVSVIAEKAVLIRFLNIDFLFDGQALSDFLLPGIIFSLLSIYPYMKSNDISYPKPERAHLTIVILSVFYLAGFVFLWNPLSVYSTFPENFVFPAIDILKNNLIIFICVFAFLSLVYFGFPKKTRIIWVKIVLLFTIISFVHNTIFPLDVGSLQETKFLNQDNLAQPLIIYFIEALAFIIVYFLISRMLAKKFLKHIIIVLLLLNTVLIAQSLVASLRSGQFTKVPEIDADINASISFSPDEENVVLLVADMFQGWYIKQIVEENPELREELSGFVWYPNTISVSSITCTSMPAVLGGYDYTIDKLNEDETRTMGEKMTDITEEFYGRIKSKGYDFTSTDMIYSKIDRNKFDSYLPKWSEEWDVWNNKLNIGTSIENGYNILWMNALFYSAPMILKTQIYKEGKWLITESKKNENSNYAQVYNFLRLLPYISNTKSDTPGFIYIHSMASHHPWDIINDDGVFEKDVTPYENNKWVINTIIKWLKWMKKEGVYDNTKIILLSDHGIHWQHIKKGTIDESMPLKNFGTSDLKVNESLVKGMFPLLMVKDYNEREPLREDDRFMSNADASYIAFDNDDPTKGEVSQDRVLPSSMANWIPKMGLEKQIKLIYNVDVTKNAYDLKNWTIKEQ
jgi:hypothetical protein